MPMCCIRMITCDLLMRLGERRLFRIVWSRGILDELCKSLIDRGVPPDRVEYRIRSMEAAFPEAMAEEIETHLSSVPTEVDAGDQHVVAAALAGRADAIVTRNVRHFPSAALAPLHIDVQDLDSFLLNQLTLDRETVMQVLAAMEEDRNRPPQTVPELLQALEGLAPDFAAAAREELLP